MSKVTMTCIANGCTDEVHRGALCDAHWEEHCRRGPPPQAAQYPRQPDPVKDGSLSAFLAEHAAAEKAMTPLAELRADLALNYKNSPWAQAQGSHGWADSLCSEAEELFDAVRLPRRPPPLCPSCIELRKDHPIKFDHIAHHVHCTADTPKPTEIRDEMGDVLWNLITLAIVTVIDFDAVVLAARDKLRRRKPWIFGIGPMPQTAEEEHAMYTENKSKEKL